MQTENILDKLKQRGLRLTKKREAIIAILSKLGKPISAPELLELLKAKKIKLNKTTVYRELYLLREEGIANEVQLGQNKKYYEISDEHHHHLICLNCESISDVIMDDKFKEAEKKIKKDKKFLVLNHSLEFFGLCQKCQ
ncbi:MAG TPA: Fur family transcriptional regulator [Patescibacteria group bacterium]|nr:Fur family transcriptional regulator [Patescibacteria group bacterium]